MTVAADWGPIESLWEVASSPNLAIDAERGVIRGVRIIGRISLNGREYTPAAISKARDLYEGKPVNLDHHEASGRDASRSVASRFGWLENVREANDGLEGDLHYLRNHPLAAQLIETAQRNPRMFGLSHNADGRTTKRGGKVFVEEIIGVRSVDLVADPATTKSLFESRLMEQNPNAPQQAQQPQQQAQPTVDPSAQQASGGSDIAEMLMAKIREILVGETDAGAKATAIAKVAKMLLQMETQIDSAIGNKEPADPNNDQTNPQKSEEKKVAEDIQKQLADTNAKLEEATAKLKAMEDKAALLEAKAAARTLLEEAKVEVSDVRIDAIVGAATPEAKKALVESWPAKQLIESVKPRSAGNVSPTGWKPPADAKEAAKRLKSGR